METTTETANPVRNEGVLSTSLGARRKRILADYAAREGLTIAEVLRRLIDAHIPPQDASRG